jgi:atlastin
MGTEAERLNGFSWSTGLEPDTNGLVIWSDVFLHTSDSGEKLAIILADTQGLFGEKVSTLISKLT